MGNDRSEGIPECFIFPVGQVAIDAHEALGTAILVVRAVLVFLAVTALFAYFQCLWHRA